MREIIFLAVLLFSPAFFSSSAHAQEDAARQAVESFQSAIRSIDASPDAAARRQRIAEANAYLDLEALSAKAMEKHWGALSEEERKKFLSLMGQLIEEVAYPKTIGFMGDYEITYPSVTPEGNGFNVESVIKQEEEGLDAQVVYHVYETAGKWKIDDVILDDVSITEDLKYQFDKIIAESGFPGLIEKMQERLDEARAEPGQQAAA